MDMYIISIFLMAICFFGVLVIIPTLDILISFLKIRKMKYVDDRKGKLVHWYIRTDNLGKYDHGANFVTLGHYIVECKIDGKEYCEEAHRLAKKWYFFKRKLKATKNEEVEIKYKINKDGEKELYIYEEKDIIKQMILYFSISAISALVIISNLEIFMS